MAREHWTEEQKKYFEMINLYHEACRKGGISAFLDRFYDTDSMKLLDEKIAFFKKVKDGDKWTEDELYAVCELMPPKGQLWDL